MTDARIHDLGYRSYDGDRRGVLGAMVALGIHAIQRVLGLKRPARHKVLPAVVIGMSMVPAIAFAGIAAILPDSLSDDALPTYGDYLSYIGMPIFLFVSFVAPEALCTDRRSGMLSLYLASPLDRTTYVASKVAAIATVLLTITLLPVLLLLLALTLEGEGPGGVVDFATTLVRVVAASTLLAAYFAAVSSAIASVTTRKGIASAAIVMTLLVSAAVSGALVEGAELADEFGLLSVGGLPFRATRYLLGEPADSTIGLGAMSGLTVLGVTALATAALLAFTWWRYQEVPADQ